MSQSAFQASALDIVDAIQKNYQDDSIPVPVFAATNLDRVPRYSPSEQTPEGISDRLFSIERRLTDLAASNVKNSDLLVSVSGSVLAKQTACAQVLE